ncbi:Hypothetical_protein [Hexamita inflata]|uniref:Hypothetical_protein n=1 Tax=Hexamita inflata TaxID=28002 RepID=A0AA86QNL6_9EUKA|nr:Hypothetical protein HINF_LOCUS42715 [Hexamita inflata]
MLNTIQDNDNRILILVAKQLKYTDDLQNLPLFYHQNKTKINKINWTEIDIKLGLKSYFSKSKSQNRFFSVLVPEIQNFIISQLEDDKQLIRSMNQDESVNYRKQLEKHVKKQFELKVTDEYSYKKQIDKNRHQIIHWISRVNPNIQQTQTEQQETQDISDLISIFKKMQV